jgi:hypothetical protein
MKPRPRLKPAPIRYTQADIARLKELLAGREQSDDDQRTAQRREREAVRG